MLWQGRSVRKPSGGRYHYAIGKKRFEIGRAPADTVIGTTRRRLIRTRGGNSKVRALRCEHASVSDKKTGITKKVVIEKVETNTANPNYVRRNLLTKGAVIRTEIGRAQIISRPGQDGTVNAVLIE